MVRSFSTVFIANRGEIAARVARSVRSRGGRAVGLYSDADEAAFYVEALDEAIRLPGRSAAETYLNIDAVVSAAKKLGAEALHPGYGFLSENADFASACEAANIVFVGPSPATIQVMGDKAQAKRLMEKYGVPTVPGYSGEAQDYATLRTEAERIGPPLLLKASAGGGGRGMRKIRQFDGLEEAISSAQREAKNAFGDSTLIIEKLIEHPRHIEVQIVADAHGTVTHLFERECSVQRRHQKIIEEAPSPAVDPELRAKLCASAVLAARSVGYVGVGTVEFLLDEEGRYYFIEMNTRLQVEHPVTELITGVDLVEVQLMVAEGQRLPALPEVFTGHAVEARVYAEDPYNGFVPCTGILEGVEWPETPEVRIDSGVSSGQPVSPEYDPMLAKVIALGRDRQQARLRLLRALESSMICGVGTNVEFLCDILRDQLFVDGEVRTDWLDQQGPVRADQTKAVALGALRTLISADESPRLGGLGRSAQLNFGQKSQKSIAARLYDADGQRFLQVNEVTYVVGRVTQTSAELDGVRYRFITVRNKYSVWVSFEGITLEVQPAAHERLGRGQTNDGRVWSPMAGQIVALLTEVGAKVEVGQPLLIIEAMKMEHELTAPMSGRVQAISCALNSQVQARQMLIEIEEV